ncbi:hypothetical protein RABR111495_21525 [Rahnella bruchi]|uniref:hypothetical protein n=1 Tax=Rahnella bruchi TaxID=1510573 RepID=UPI000EA02783|nr:hypothetical protein [Rahnella bruchi]
MDYTIWLMEGLSSQRYIISGIHDLFENIQIVFLKNSNIAVIVVASHCQKRNEILSQANVALIEPDD